MGDDVDRVRRALPSLQRYAETQANDTVDLRKEGGELRGENPWHGSSTGNNFALDPGEGRWYCHSKGCETGGGILEYIAVDENIVDCGETDDLATVFPEVLEVAAEIAGIDLDMDARSAAEVKEARETRERLDNIMEATTAFYHDNLDVAIPAGDGETVVTVRDFLNHHYGLSDETINEWMVGFAPNDERALVNTLSYGEKDLLEAGLAVDTHDGVKDFYDGRIMFPYFYRGTPRYFIGRKTALTPDEDWERGKYKKLPTADNKDYVSGEVEEPIFGRDTVRGANRVIVTEGVTDVLAAQQAGYTAIAPVTTSFKKRRVRDVARLVRNKQVTVIMDEDAESEAGLQGAIKTAKALDEYTGPATEVNVARLPLDDGDLCDYLRENGDMAGGRA